MIDRTFGIGLLMLVAGGWIHDISAQGTLAASVRDGIYTAEQAGRGEAGYKESCASCHGPTLEGRGQTPPLTGSEFTSAWEGMTMWDLFDKVQVTMPADKPGSLPPVQNAAIVAYILKANDFPAGAKELGITEEQLKPTQFEAPPK